LFAFCGKSVNNGTVADHKISNESTVHLVKVPSITVTVSLDGEKAEVSVPKDAIVRDIKRQVRNAFPHRDFGRQLPNLERDGENLDDSKGVSTYEFTKDTILIVKPQAVPKSKSSDGKMEKNEIYKEIDDEEKKKDLLANFM